MDLITIVVRSFFQENSVSFMFNLIMAVFIIILSQGVWRTSMPKNENLWLSVGGLITFLMSFFAPDSILPLLMGVTWMLVAYLRLEKIDSPTLWCIVAILGAVLALLSFSVWSVIATPLSLVGGAYVIYLAIEKIPTS